MSRHLFVATKNRDKLRELAALLDEDVELHHPEPEDEEVEETGETLWENALLKARSGFERSGMASIADDTGLGVDTLGGGPGVYSSRYAGDQASYEDNVRKLLSELGGTVREKRIARFRTVIAYVDGEVELRFDGVLEGVIINERRGENGFGYDPVFLPEGGSLTLAELSSEEKNRISHRGRALRSFIDWWNRGKEREELI